MYPRTSTMAWTSIGMNSVILTAVVLILSSVWRKLVLMKGKWWPFYISLGFNTTPADFFLQNEDFSYCPNIWPYDNLLEVHSNSIGGCRTKFILNCNIHASKWDINNVKRPFWSWDIALSIRVHYVEISVNLGAIMTPSTGIVLSYVANMDLPLYYFYDV